MDERLVDLLYQARFLKRVPRSGFQFLGAGEESVAEHCFSAAFVGLVLAQMEPQADTLTVLGMCLVHDLAEARIGDLNYVQKAYVQADEEKAIADSLADATASGPISAWLQGFNDGHRLEARLAADADQIALLLELKALDDVGYKTPTDWIPNVQHRLKTEAGRRLAQAVLSTRHDRWWRKIFIDSNNVHS